MTRPPIFEFPPKVLISQEVTFSQFFAGIVLHSLDMHGKFPTKGFATCEVVFGFDDSHLRMQSRKRALVMKVHNLCMCLFLLSVVTRLFFS